MRNSAKQVFIYSFLIGQFFLANRASAQACFRFVSDSLGCAPFTVKVKSCASGSPIVSFNFRWRPNPNPSDYQTLPVGVEEAEFTYNEPGTYIIEQLLGGGQTLQRIVKVFNISTKPTFDWFTCQDSLKIQFTDTIFRTYQFEAGDGNPTPILAEKANGNFSYKYLFAGLSSTYTFSVKGLSPSTCNQEKISDEVTLYKVNAAPVVDSMVGTDTSTYKIQIKARADEPYIFQTRQDLSWVDVAKVMSAVNLANRKDTILLNQPYNGVGFRGQTRNGCGQLLNAPEISLVWPKLDSENQRITVSWPGFDASNLAVFDLLRNGQRIANLRSLADTSYVDSSNLVCGLTYCYQFLMKWEVAGYPGALIYLSAPICGQAISSRPPDPVRYLNVSVENNALKLSGLANPLASSYQIFRKSSEEATFRQIASTGRLPYLDESALVNQESYCFTVSFLDICGNRSRPSDTVCSILLQMEERNPSERQFSWTPLLGWEQGVNRYVFQIEGKNGILEELDRQSALNYFQSGRMPLSQSVVYRIKAIPNNAGFYPDASFSNPVSVMQKRKFAFPEIFTPNQDGQNEVFKCYSLFVEEFELKIFNAWGNILFYTTKLNEGWDGKIDSRPAPSGPYAYWARGKDQEGNWIETKGYFSLVR